MHIHILYTLSHFYDSNLCKFIQFLVLNNKFNYHTLILSHKAQYLYKYIQCLGLYNTFNFDL